MVKLSVISIREEVKRFILLDLIGVLTGIIGGLGAIVFRELINLNKAFFFGFLAKHLAINYGGYNLAYIFLPAIGGMIVGPIVYKYAYEAKGHGVPEVLEALRLRGGRIRKRVAFVKILVSSTTIGSGGSAGREGPIAQIGASFGSLIGDLLNLGEKDRRLIVVAGLSAGIAGTFNAPLGGALFGLEVLLGGLVISSAVAIIISSVVGAAVVAAYYGLNPAFIVPTGLTFVNPAELLVYGLFGIIMGFISVFWVKLFYAIEEFYARLNAAEWVKPAIGGLATGIIGFSFIEYGIMGVGYVGMEKFWLSEGVGFTIGFLFLLAFLKMIATSNTIGSGGSGGVFAPTLFIGAMLGGGFGLIFEALFPDIVHHPLTYSLVGMGALFAGVAHAPITMIVMIPEMTGDYSLLPPMMMACSVSYIVSKIMLGDENIYVIKLKKRGVRLIPKVDLEVLGALKVSEFMTKEVVTVSPDTNLEVVYKYIATRHHGWYPVVEDGKLVGVVKADDILNIPPYMLSKHTVRDVMDKKLITITEDKSIKDAIEKMHTQSTTKLIVVSKKDPKKLVGIITKTDILRAYEYISSL